MAKKEQKKSFSTLKINCFLIRREYFSIFSLVEKMHSVSDWLGKMTNEIQIIARTM